MWRLLRCPEGYAVSSLKAYLGLLGCCTVRRAVQWSLLTKHTEAWVLHSPEGCAVFSLRQTGIQSYMKGQTPCYGSFGAGAASSIAPVKHERCGSCK